MGAVPTSARPLIELSNALRLHFGQMQLRRTVAVVPHGPDISPVTGWVSPAGSSRKVALGA
ncbi:MAG: hypothetical protein U0401_31170 [Anaerolineae bacterium]